MVETAVLIGIDPMRFWDYTPKEISFLFNSYIENEKNKAKDIISLAWYTEAFHRTKRLPKLKDLLKDKKKEMSDEEMLKKVKSLNAALGGEVNGRS